MKNQALIQEVISQISQRFAPKIPDIKKVRNLFPSKFRLLIYSSGDRNSPRERIHGACRWFKRYIRLHRLSKCYMGIHNHPFPWYTLYIYIFAQSIPATLMIT